MRVYLASPYGFGEQWKRLCLPEIKKKIESFGHEVWEPFERNNQIDFSKEGWAHQIAHKDRIDVQNCDAIFAVLNGTPPDEGVMIELGMAIALKKKIYLFRDDFRKCTDSQEYPLNLMIFSGFEDHNEWKHYYFKSIDEIKL